MNQTSQQAMTDSAIAGVYRFLKGKAEKPFINQEGIDPFIVDMLKVNNDGTLRFFEIMFKSDLERLGLI